MSKHTPGPWLVWDEEVHGDGFTHNEWPHVMTHDGYAVCDLCDWGSLSFDEQKENALLIAAAPELLTSCVAMLAERSGAAQLSDACQQARAAIAKATGEQP